MEPARTFVATLPVGYADGCGRLLSNRAQVLIGRQGAGEITADEVAALQGTISYEILCRIGPRVPRVYLR